MGDSRSQGGFSPIGRRGFRLANAVCPKVRGRAGRQSNQSELAHRIRWNQRLFLEEALIPIAILWMQIRTITWGSSRVAVKNRTWRWWLRLRGLLLLDPHCERPRQRIQSQRSVHIESCRSSRVIEAATAHQYLCRGLELRARAKSMTARAAASWPHLAGCARRRCEV